MIARACPVPKKGLLQAYVGQGATYTDCFEVVTEQSVDLPAFIEAFYTTWLFRMERAVLGLTLRRKITDHEVSALAEGANRFAVWEVESRNDTQILLKDRSGHTRSFLAVDRRDTSATRLVFGSAVVAPQGQPLARLVRLSIPLHRFYSKALLGLALRKVRRG